MAYRKIILALFLLLLIVNAFATTWWDTNWSYRQQITLKTSDMNLFADVNGKIHALSLHITSSNTDFWTNVRSDLNDIRFIDNNGQQMKWFIEDGNYTAKDLWIWLKVDNNFTKNSNTIIGNMYYGNHLAIVSDANENATYPSTYLRAFNFNSSNYLYDSTGSGNNLTNTGGTTIISNWGIGKAVAINGASGLNGFTAQFPTNSSFANGYTVILLAASHSPSGTSPYESVYRHVGTGTYLYNGEIDFYGGQYEFTALTAPPTDIGSVSADTKYHLVLTAKFGTGTGYLYSNGLQVGSKENQHDTILTTSAYIGRHPSSSGYGLDGNIDALRLLNYQISADEVKLINQTDTNSANVFLFGAQESLDNQVDINLQVKDIFDNLDLINSMDCNSGQISYASQQSPYVKRFPDTNKTYTCTFTSLGYDTNTINIYTDVNKTVLVLLKDTTPPVVGMPKTTGFSFYNSDFNYIRGTGQFYVDFNNIGHRDNMSCVYTLDNNANWYSGIMNMDANTCSTPNITITDINYNVRFKVYDESLNEGISSLRLWIGDTTPPNLTIDTNQIQYTNKNHITITCIDTQSGCKNVYYTINNSSVYTYTTDFNYIGTGEYLIQAWAIDNVDNNSYPGTITNFYTYGYFTIKLYDANSTYTYDVNTDGNKVYNYTLTQDLTWVNEQTYTLPSTTINYPNSIYAYGFTGSYFGFVARFRFYNENGNLVSTQYVDSSNCGDQLYVTCLANKSILVPYDIKSYKVDLGCWSGSNLPTTPGYCTGLGPAPYSIVYYVRLDYQTNPIHNTPINNPTINFNGTNYLTIDNNFIIPLQGIAPNEYTFIINANNYNHCNPKYQTTLNQYTFESINFGLINDANCIINELKLYRPNQFDLYTNTYITLINQKNNLILGKGLTNAQGEISMGFNLSDQNYVYTINNGTDYYTPVALTVLYPKDEQTLAQIIYPWRISITQNFFALYENLTANKIIYLLPNTKLPYNIEVSDMNNQYFPRSYSAIYPGNPQSSTLQPYLVSDLNGLVTIIHTISSYTNQPVKGVTVKIYKYIPSIGLTYVEQLQTDSKGEAMSVLLIGNKYQFILEYGNQTLRTDEITVTSSTIYIKIPDLNYSNPSLGGFNINIKYSPELGQLTKNDSNLTQTISILDYNSNIRIDNVWIQVWNIIDQNQTLLIEKSYLQPFSNSNTLSNFFTIDSTYNTIQGIAYNPAGNLLIKVIISTPDRNVHNQKNYKPYNMLSIIDNIGVGARTSFGCPAYYDSNGNPNFLVPCPSLLFIAIIISLLATIGLSLMSGFISIKSSGTVFVLIMGLFTYLTWVPVGLYAIMLASSFAFYMVRGWIR